MSARAIAIGLVAVLGFAGCQTTSPPPSEGAIPVGTIIPFAPATPQATLQFDAGRYPSLLAESSYALWVDASVSAARMDEARTMGEAPDANSTATAAALDATFHVFELHLDSRFADSAIGYDIVGLRGVDFYLEKANGETIRPVRTAAGELTEGNAGALMTFSRTVLVGFPRDSLQLTVTMEEARSTSLRLVIEGHGTKYYFEWFPMLPEVYMDGRAVRQRQVNAAKMRYDAYYAKVRQWIHTFD